MCPLSRRGSGPQVPIAREREGGREGGREGRREGEREGGREREIHRGYGRSCISPIHGNEATFSH